MSIKDRNLKPGTKLVARYHKQSFSCEVVEGEGGKLRYRLSDGREFKSPSAAGMAITGHACDGWVFWNVATAEVTQKKEVEKQPPIETTETQDTEDQKETPIDTAPAAGEPGPAKKRIFRLPNQKGVSEGQTRWYCHDCGKSFLAATGQTPEVCPVGHQAS